MPRIAFDIGVSGWWGCSARLALAALLTASFCPPVKAQVTADRVYGQPNFTTGGYANGSLPPAARLYKPRGLAVTEDGVYIADEGYNRVLFFPHDETQASAVYGQWDFTTTTNNGPGLNASSLSKPWNIEANATGLYVADWRNCRALRFPLDSKTADMVYGQPNFGSSHPTWAGISPRSIAYPDGITADSEGGVYVTDTFRTRVMYYPPGSNVATRVYGAPDMYTQMVSSGPQYFGGPRALAVDSTGLYVVDQGNNRVLFFPNGSTTATRVYGQPDFYKAGPNTGGISANSLSNPMEVALDGSGVYICDQGNNRVLYYPGTSTTASHVYGQASFTTAAYLPGGINGQNLASPAAVAADDFAVYVSDPNLARVLRFPKQGENVPRSVAFRMMPGSGAAGQPLSVQPVVEVRRADGSVAEDYNGPVRIRIKEGPDCAAVGGTSRVQAVNGVAVFTDIRLDTAGSYRLAVNAGTLDGATSDVLTVASGTTSPFDRGDINRNGVLDIGDVSLMYRALFGLETLQ